MARSAYAHIDLDQIVAAAAARGNSGDIEAGIIRSGKQAEGLESAGSK